MQSPFGLNKGWQETFRRLIRPLRRLSPSRNHSLQCGEAIIGQMTPFACADAHGFPPDFPSVEAATQLATAFIGHPETYGVAAEENGSYGH
jgi:hypothetical protein